MIDRAPSDIPRRRRTSHSADRLLLFLGFYSRDFTRNEIHVRRPNINASKLEIVAPQLFSQTFVKNALPPALRALFKQN